MIQVSPSILSADFSNLSKDLEMINNSKAAMVHLDVMDGVFVPNISFGFPVIKAISKLTSLPLDVHLMIQTPGNYVSQCRDCGASIMNVHVEACTHLNRVIQQIKNAGMRAAVTLNPATPLCMLEEVISDVDMVLLMSVNPGFSGQQFITGTVNKVKRLRELITTSGSNAFIQVDGGINCITGAEVVKEGAASLVAGNYIFKSTDPIQAINALACL